MATFSWIERNILVATVLLGSACGGAAVADPASANSAGAGGADTIATGGAATASTGGTETVATAGAPSTGGAVGSAGASAAGAGGATAPCVPKDPEEYPGTCTDLARLRLVDPIIADDSGDGVVSPGESFTVTVSLEDVSGYGYFMYPCVAFDGLGVTNTTPHCFYGVAKCGSMPASMRVDMSPYTTPGEIITVNAQLTALNQDCPNPPSLAIPITLGPYR